MAGEDMPASADVAVNDHVTGSPPQGTAGELRLQTSNRSGAGLSGLRSSVPDWMRHLAVAALGFQAFFAMTHFGWQFRSEFGSYLLLAILLLVGGGPWRELAKQPVGRAVLLFTVFLVFQA